MKVNAFLTWSWVQVLIHRWRALRLASKLNVALVALGALGIAISGMGLNWAIRPAFEGLERAAMEEQIGRANSHLQSTLATIESVTKDYAIWDDSYEYVHSRDPAFELETDTVLALVNLDVNARAYVTFGGDVLHARYVDLAAEADDAALTAAFEQFVSSDQFIAQARAQPHFATFVEFGGRVVSISSAQIRKSDGSGEVTAVVVMAREFDAATASAALQNETTVALGAPSELVVKTPDQWLVSVPITSTGGAQIGHMAYAMPRSVYQLGAATIGNALLVSALLMAIALILVFLLVRIVVVRRVNVLEHHMHKVAADGALTPPKEDANADEIGALGRSFTQMLGELKHLREKTEAQSFELGKSESAAGALHNVRNSLSPVNVIISQALAQQSVVRAEDVERAVAELAAGDAEPARRERLGDFLRAAVAAVQKEASARREVLSNAKTSLAEAMGILRTQTEDAHKDIPLEHFDLLEVLTNNAVSVRHVGQGEIAVELPHDGVAVYANRLLTSQVIGNVFTNAVEAITASGRARGRIVVALRPGEGEAVEVTITDDGAGFGSERALQLFERGYSTKPGRSSGLGLHWCANTIKAMGGALSLTSDGPGLGAAATIVLPSSAAAKARWVEQAAA